ncbi:hypothetical protein QOZ83_01440 [Romboutsia sedimentorum]|uniref:hypothetical protein n=1 Tax=Romboutsia sedimentorum TaxID=1368474 RepID=UPI0024DE8C7F|nr:hypothetical protein [Romboutsia sedimentorum]MDK2584510.1 hypothetical protein [Romboutsia sedimentorum]
MKKKYNKTILIITTIFIIMVICLVVDIILNKTLHTKYEKFNSTDKEMFEKLSNIYGEFNENSDELWSENYKLNEMPMILIRTNKDKGIVRKYAYAINVGDIDKSIFAKKMTMPKGLKLPQVYRLSKFDTNMISTWFPSNFGTINLEGKQAFYFKYHPKMIENPDLYFDFSSFLLHESFHVYNQENWMYDKLGNGEYIENYPTNKENYALMGVEFELLDKCMQENNKSEIKRYLKQWTMIRAYRYEKWPQLIAETKTEAIEGTARYIEYKYSKLMGENLTVLATKDKPYHVTFTYAFDCIASGKGPETSYLKRTMKYETGSALGLIMDNVNIKWKKDIEDSKSERGETQYEILKKYFNISNEDIIEDNIKQIKEQNNYNALLQKGQAIVDLENNKI